MNLTIKAGVPSYLVACTLLLLPLRAAAAGAPEEDAAVSRAGRSGDRAWEELRAEEERGFPDDINAWPASRRVQWMEDASRTLQEKALAFFETHSRDPRRWQAFVTMLKHRRNFVVGFKPGYDEQPDSARLIIDEAARGEWQERMARIDAEMAAAHDVPAAVREERAALELNPDVFRAFTNRFEGDWTELGRRVEQFTARFPASRQARGFESRFLSALERSDAPAAEERARRLAVESSSEGVRELMNEWLRTSAERRNTVDLRFTAVDGREVDFHRLRGKVVLIDFWATWCGPCIKELPNVKQVYADYHDKGFEIVGVSLDKEGDRQALLDFVQNENMPWPQHFDGRHWRNEIAVRYGIKGIPAMFLVDQAGRIVSTSARGEELGREVRRLLGARAGG